MEESHQVGLYDPRDEHDACGIGLLVDMKGRRSHQIVSQSVEALAHLSHRGGVGADGRTGDGSGVLTQIPWRLLAGAWPSYALADEVTREVPRFAVGMVFLSAQEALAKRSCKTVEEIVCANGMLVLGWRDVPVALEVLGLQARESCPSIKQFLLAFPEGSEADLAARSRMLYRVRRLMQKGVADAGCEPFHVCSLSTQTIVYKGLIDSPDLASFYKDLADPLYESSSVIFHQRFSTNTSPMWHLAQPFRFLAHNGEINTIRGNINWMRARQPVLKSHLFGEQLADVFPIVNERDSDSATLDRVFEFLVMAGVHPWHALAMLIPEAHQHHPQMDASVRAMFAYYASRMEPWDGPAAVAVSDGTRAFVGLDRNGLRPLRYSVHQDGILLASSEAGILPWEEEAVIERGRLGPGQMLAVDTASGRWWRNDELKREMSEMLPFEALLERQLLVASSLDIPLGFCDGTKSREVSWLDEEEQESDHTRLQKLFGYGKETVERILKPMWTEGKLPIGSMGDDTPLAFLSSKPQLLYRYFKQRFAQVTNPPIDPIREAFVMSLNTCVGRRGSLLSGTPTEERVGATPTSGGEARDGDARMIRFSSPIISGRELGWLQRSGMDGFDASVLQVRFLVEEGPEGMERALEALCLEAAAAVSGGSSLLILSDRGVGKRYAPIPMLLATAAVQQHLIREGLRLQCSLICDAGDVRSDHHVACLLGFGASLVHPYLALQTIADAIPDEGLRQEAFERYKKALEKGLRKTLSRMGIATLASYRGAQMFEILGLSKALVDRFFYGTIHRIDGVSLEQIGADVLRYHAEAYGEQERLFERGIYRYRRNGEYHAFNPPLFKMLHKAVREESMEAYEVYADSVENQAPCHLRDLFQWSSLGPALPLEEVEPVEAIAQRFCTQAMSHGALSREAHEVLSIAMNRIGGRSNSGEGGEAAERFQPYTEETAPAFPCDWKPAPGDWGNSSIKQVATGRFGVTPAYLVSASELEIKMAQGAKPGEGGQIPGFKVSEEIATLRRAAPGIPLISPPPHHDIYSIEDLEQLIHDLRHVNREARIVVKLVSMAGVGTIAAGVAKARADCIQISGHDGGTGASPLSSIKHAGLPWEIGLAEAQQVLVRNGLRGRVRLRVDGGMRTGRDVLIGALLGAEEFGFGTAALIATGCVMARQCHANTCPVGIATQRADLRGRFPGRPEHIISLMMYIAQQVRMLLAQMGARSLKEVIGRPELLALKPELSLQKLEHPRLDELFANPASETGHDHQFIGEVDESPRVSALRLPLQALPEGLEEVPEARRSTMYSTLDQSILELAYASIETQEPFRGQWSIDNRQRSVGAGLAGAIARNWGERGCPDDTFQLTFRGAAGQSFGAFCTHGMTLSLEGEAQDYVAKGMHGGRLILRPQAYKAGERGPQTIIGNTCMYGATGGKLFVAGRAGERFCVRNSGGVAVVEGTGDHPCEYMTSGVAVILGSIGHNLGAGMSGGIAFVLDLEEELPIRTHPEMVDLVRLTPAHEAQLHGLIEEHVFHTHSPHGQWILDGWGQLKHQFWAVCPKASLREALPEEAPAKKTRRSRPTEGEL